MKNRNLCNETRALSQASVWLTFEDSNSFETLVKRKNVVNEKFRGFLLEAVDEGLSSLGESSKQAFYCLLEMQFGVKKFEIPDKIEEFADAVEKIFGEGSSLLEILIMKRIHAKVGNALKYYPNKDKLLFREYIRAHETI